jgi:hypothetical protein
MLGNAKGTEKEQWGIQRNPFWPPNGPSFFFDLRDSVAVYFTHCPSRAVGFGLKLRGADAEPTKLQEVGQFVLSKNPQG